MTSDSDRALLQSILDDSPFQALIGLKVLDFDADGERLDVALPYDAALARMSGSRQLHGGAIAAAIDIVGAAMLGVRYRIPIATIDYHVDYLRPADGADLVLRARLRKAGRTLNLVDIEVEDAQSRLIALGRARYVTPAVDR